jgi:sulfur carrier protein
MKVTINGRTKEINTPLSVKDLLAQEGFDGMVVAAARNGAFLPRSAYTNTIIEDGDDFEIVSPMQGG